MKDFELISCIFNFLYKMEGHEKYNWDLSIGEMAKLSEALHMKLRGKKAAKLKLADWKNSLDFASQHTWGTKYKAPKNIVIELIDSTWDYVCGDTDYIKYIKELK